MRPGGGLIQEGVECAVVGALEDIFHSSAILGALVQGLSRSTVDEGSGSFLCWVLEDASEEGLWRSTGDEHPCWVPRPQAVGSTWM